MSALRPQADIRKEKSRKDLREMREGVESGCQQPTEIKNMKFQVLIIRQENPTDGTNGHHDAHFATRREAMAYAATELGNGYERAAIIQRTVRGQRRIATLTA
jgi:hypothetical protein